MGKRFIILSSFFLLCFLCGCGEKQIDFIELTNGRSMDPAQPRIGVKITSDNDLYVCIEIISNGKRTGHYKYYKSNTPINFEKYKTKIVNYFNNNVARSYIEVNDATFYQLFYTLDKKIYRSKFIESDLNNYQIHIIFELTNLSKTQELKKISNYNFSKELLEEKLPSPPPL